MLTCIIVTTVMPQIGTITRSGTSELSIADLPGLVEGAHKNVGRGHKFLQHLERTKVLVYVLDVSGFQLSRRQQVLDPYNTVQVLVNELELYSSGLAHKEAILVVNKMDYPGALSKFERLLEKLKGHCPVNFHSIIACSAANRTGTQTIKEHLLELFPMSC